MEKSVFIISEIDAIIEIDFQRKEILAGIPVKTSINENAKITYYPINTQSSKYLPFCFEFSEKESQHYIKYKLKDALVLKINPMRVPKYSFVFEEEIEGKKYCLHSGYPSFFTVSENDKVIFSKKANCNFKEPTIKKRASSVIFSAKWNDQIYFLIFNGKTEIFSGFASEYKYEQDSLNLVSWQKDMAKQGYLYKININSGTVSKSLIYYEPPKVISNQKLIPYAFFEAVKTKNYKLARKYLSSALNLKIADEHFAAFFGKFSDVTQNYYLPSPQTSVALIYDSPSPEIKIFEIKFTDEKIADINELN